MKRKIKILFFKILGKTQYLKWLNRGFFLSYNAGLLKNNPIYKYHYFAKNLIKKGDTVIDIGANLGYYTKLFSEWVGIAGKVYAVEPIRDYVDIINWAIGSRKNIEILPYALGNEERQINMVILGKHGYLRTGLPQVQKADDGDNYEFSFPTQMKKGSDLFKNLSKVNFIKCDIEGYEEIVIPEIREVIQKHKPIIQVETFGEQRQRVEKFTSELGYSCYELRGKKLKKISPSDPNPGDIIFIHEDHKDLLEKLRNRSLLI